MICVILCAGYATRMYPLTENFPKPLLPVRNKPIMDYLIDDLTKIQTIKKYIIVSNHKFIHHFKEWSKSRRENIEILDDGSTKNENRLGAVTDISFAIEKCGITDDILVLAGDNLLDFSLTDFIDTFEKNKKPLVMRYFESNEEKLKRTGVIQIDKDGKIIDMQEKPSNPQSNWAVPPFYIFPHFILQEFAKSLKFGCKKDAPGEFLEYLISKIDVYTYLMPGHRIDIGDLKTYESLK